MRVFHSLEELTAAVGEEIGPTEWMVMTQERVDTFAEATGDHQWIHVDRARAAAGPYGGTIAHGYLTLSLVPVLASQLFHIDHMGAKLNYGVNKVRFPAPLLVGKRIRLHVRLGEVVDIPSGKQLTVHHTVEIEDEAKPACVAETVVLLRP